MQTTDENRTVLVVNRGISLRLQLEIVFQNKNFGAVSVSSGEECLLIAPSLRPSLILIGTDLDSIGSTETCRLIVENDDLTNIPVVFLSDELSPITGEEVTQAGGKEVVCVPLDEDIAVLEEAMTGVISRYLSYGQ